MLHMEYTDNAFHTLIRAHFLHKTNAILQVVKSLIVNI